MHLFKVLLVLAIAVLAACASSDRRVEASRLISFTLNAAPIKSLRVVLVPTTDSRLTSAQLEARFGWNTRVFDEQFGPRLVANFRANGVAAAYSGASGLRLGEAQATADSYLMTIELKQFRYSTRYGAQDGLANYVVRISLYPAGSTTPVVQYDDGMERSFQGVPSNIPDRFTYAFFNLLRDRGQWPAAKVELAN